MNGVSIESLRELSFMIDEYAIDLDIKDIMSALATGKKEEPYRSKVAILSIVISNVLHITYVKR